MARYVIRIAHQAGLIALFVAVAILGTVSGVLFASAGDLPQISALDDYAPRTITRVYAAGGEVIGEFATQRRVVITYDDISPRLREAIIAAEDAGFNSHFGVSLPRLAVTIVTNIFKGQVRGASTLTQQLARNLFLTPEKIWSRKIKELILTIQIEKRYTKEEILTLYCNQIFFGHGAHGVEAAARMYFDKSASDLELEEAALLAGVIQTPSRQSPFVSLDRANARRSYVLTQMEELGYITANEAAAAREAPIEVVDRRRQQSIAPYFVEEVRQHLEANYGVKQLYENGLSVYTSLDVDLQRAANRALTRRAAPSGQAPWISCTTSQRDRGGDRARRLRRSALAQSDAGGGSDTRAGDRRERRSHHAANRAPRGGRSAETASGGPDASRPSASSRRAISCTCRSLRLMRRLGAS